MVEQKRIRLNRKDGRVYLDHGDNQIQKIGSYIDGVILWHSHSFVAELFGMPRQSWIQVALISQTSDNLIYFMLNSGHSYALKPFTDYVEGLKTQGTNTLSVITRCGFELFGSDWYDYSFQPFAKQAIRDRISRWIFANPRLSLIDETLPIEIQHKLRGRTRFVRDLIPIFQPSPPKYTYHNGFEPLDSFESIAVNEEIPF